jgi:hypothetical protein
MGGPGAAAPANDGTASAVAKIKPASNVIMPFMAYEPSFRARLSYRQVSCQTPTTHGGQAGGRWESEI